MTRSHRDTFVDQYGALRRTIDAASSQAYAELDLGTAQVRLLRAVAQAPRTSQAALARSTAADPALAGRTLQTLIERGLLVRARSEEDRREYVLDLTAAGRRTLKRVERVRARLIRRMTAPLDDRDLADFARIAGKLIGALH